MKPHISTTEWLAELERTMSAGAAEGMTTREISKAIGMGLDATGRRLRLLYEDGRLGAGWRRSMGRDGIERLRPVYWIKQPSKNGNRAAGGPRKGGG